MTVKLIVIVDDVSNEINRYKRKGILGTFFLFGAITIFVCI